MCLVCKPGRLGLPNLIIEDSDSDDDKFGQQLRSDLDFKVEIRFRLNGLNDNVLF